MVHGKVTKHALSRMVERNIMSQNIKPNKKQVKRHTKKAMKELIIDLSNKFAISVSNDFLYYYCDIKNDCTCKKYVLDRYSKKVITVIKDINLDTEVKRYHLTLCGNGHEVKHYISSDYVYKSISNNEYLFVINPFNRFIYSCNHIG